MNLINVSNITCSIIDENFILYYINALSISNVQFYKEKALFGYNDYYIIRIFDILVRDAFRFLFSDLLYETIAGTECGHALFRNP